MIPRLCHHVVFRKGIRDEHNVCCQRNEVCTPSWKVGDGSALEALDHETAVDLRVRSGRSVQNMSHGDIRKSRKSPSELCISSCSTPFPICLVSLLLKMFVSGSHMKENDNYSDHWGSDWRPVGWTSALELLWNRLTWYFFLTTPEGWKKMT